MASSPLKQASFVYLNVEELYLNRSVNFILPDIALYLIKANINFCRGLISDVITGLPSVLFGNIRQLDGASNN